MFVDFDICHRMEGVIAKIVFCHRGQSLENLGRFELAQKCAIQTIHVYFTFAIEGQHCENCNHDPNLLFQGKK